MTEEPDLNKRQVVVKIPILKKKTMHLPILSLQTEQKMPKGPKIKQLRSERKKDEKSNISQLLNILECPQPTDNYFLMRPNPIKKFRNRQLSNRSEQSIEPRKNVEDLLHGLKAQFGQSLQKAIKRKEIPTLRNLRLFIERHRSQNQTNKKVKQKQSQRIYKTLEGVQLTSNQVKIVPNYNCHRYLTEQSLQNSLLRKDDLKRQIRNRYKQEKIRLENKSEQRGKNIEGEEYLTGWHQLRHRYKSWEAEETPDNFQCQYFQS